MSRDSKRTLTKVNERFALTQTNYLIFTFFHSYFTRSKRPCSLMPCDSYGKLLLTLGCLADVFPITRSPDHRITRSRDFITEPPSRHPNFSSQSLQRSVKIPATD
jgi:hypothetical protein